MSICCMKYKHVGINYNLHHSKEQRRNVYSTHHVQNELAWVQTLIYMQEDAILRTSEGMKASTIRTTRRPMGTRSSMEGGGGNGGSMRGSTNRDTVKKKSSRKASILKQVDGGGVCSGAACGGIVEQSTPALLLANLFLLIPPSMRTPLPVCSFCPLLIALLYALQLTTVPFM